MDFQQLKYFQTLADVKNFSRASVTLDLSQPALSRSISRLEQEIGVPLFERKSHGVELNKYGKIFLQHTNQALLEIHAATQEINDLNNPLNGTVSLAFIQTLGSSFVPELISDFRQEAPKLTFQLYQHTTSEILDRLASTEIDIGFCSPQGPLEKVSSLPIVKDELFLIVPHDHRLAGRKEVDLSEVANDPFVLFKPETAIRDVIEEICHKAGFHPKKAFEGLEERTVAGLVGAKFGVAIIPFIPGLDKEKISMIRIKNPQSVRVISMVWRTTGYMSPAVLKFKTFVETTMALSQRDG
ncbi:LysR family transcriptional regulator [Bacillus sp. mrc49]|uniref:LysR family transcriptional regulator n=1 Tax=Bacillus sp. mrc49 TaxID=2054913 RepID=UPI000C2736B2|nr:LysR family transcriptional regulator [Bacillus sp. mrc49]PJN90712.1 LysR family transcriptional regulator [Bacillus sp. mrc49]